MNYKRTGNLVEVNRVLFKVARFLVNRMSYQLKQNSRKLKKTGHLITTFTQVMCDQICILERVAKSQVEEKSQLRKMSRPKTVDPRGNVPSN